MLFPVFPDILFKKFHDLRHINIPDLQIGDCQHKEVRELLEYYDVADHYEEVKRWYDGYQFTFVP